MFNSAIVRLGRIDGVSDGHAVRRKKRVVIWDSIVSTTRRRAEAKDEMAKKVSMTCRTMMQKALRLENKSVFSKKADRSSKV